MIKIKSNVTGIKYDPAEVVFFTCIPQIALYIQNNAQIVDVNVNKNNKLAIAFWVKDHIRLSKIWNNRELNNSDEINFG